MTDYTVLTGASGVIGNQVLSSLLPKGGRFVAFTGSNKGAKFLEKQYSDYMKSDHLQIYAVDFLEKAAIDNYAKIIETLPISCLINNGRSRKFLTIENNFVSKESFLSEFQLAVDIPYRLSLVTANLSKNLSSIINIASMYGVVAANPALYDSFENESPIHYSVSKAAQIHLTKELAIRLKDKKIRVNCISYGGIKGRVNDEFISRYQSLCPSQKMLDVEEVVSPIEFLMNPNSSALNGHNLIADGGWSIW